MKIVNNRKMLISLMTVFGFSVLVKSNCCMAMGRVVQAEQAREAEQARQAEQARARQAEQARQAQLEEENRRAQDINDIGARLQIVENNLQDQINPNINAVENELRELRRQIARQGRHITFLDLFDLLLGGAVVVIGAVYYLRGSSRK